MNESARRAGEGTDVAGPPPRRGRLFHKYVALFMAVVSAALLASGLLEIWFSYREHTDSLVRVQREQAEAAAAKIGQFVKEIEGQIGWTTQFPWSAGALEQRRFDALRLLRQVPAITELAQLDAQGREQLRVSRLAMDVIGSQADLSKEPKFAEAVARKVYYGPVYFRRESEPYMTLAMAGQRRDAGVSVAEVNLKFIWDVVSQIKVGREGRAYVVDAGGRLIAHPDISLVLRNTDLSRLPQVRAARVGGAAASLAEAMDAFDALGRAVIATHAAVPALGWAVLVELPREEALAPLYASALRTGALLLLGLGIAFLAGLFLARRMVVPIEALRAGAAEIGGGDLGRRIVVKTGDELEALADQFNRMGAQLRESYAGLERKIDERTRELAEALEYQTATSEVLGVVSRSPGALEPVFQAMLANAMRICEAKFGIMFRYEDGAFRSISSLGVPPAFADYLREPRVWGPNTGLGQILHTKHAVHILDVCEGRAYAEREPNRMAAVDMGGIRTLVVVPILKDDEVIGAFSIYRQEVRPFTDRQIDLVTSFAHQAVIAIENVRLLNELRARTSALTRSVAELKALGEVSQAVNSSLDLETVLRTILVHACEISDSGGGAIYVYDAASGHFELKAGHGMSDKILAAVRKHRPRIGDTIVGKCAAQRAAVQVSDVTAAPQYPLLQVLIEAGVRAVLGVPLLYQDQVIGALIVRRKRTGAFAPEIVGLLQTFATQSALAIQNARLFHEIEDKGRQLAVASQHKSQFLANMSHELRTPLNAILGYTELILDNIYGETPDKVRGVLERVQSNGRHLLGLINDVLDLSKIEAGQLTLSLADYSLKDVVQGALAAVEALAAEKRLSLKLDLAPDLPPGRGDERRIAQVLLNLLGNAIKFTDAGEVGVSASAANGIFTLAVRDTGPGIAEADQRRIFEEFQQVDSSETRKKGGTGLGLAISRRIVEMHGGRMWVESSPGLGSTFSFTLPVTVERQAEAA